MSLWIITSAIQPPRSILCLAQSHPQLISLGGSVQLHTTALPHHLLDATLRLCIGSDVPSPEQSLETNHNASHQYAERQTATILSVILFS